MVVVTRLTCSSNFVVNDMWLLLFGNAVPKEYPTSHHKGLELRQRQKFLTLPNSPSRPPSVLQLHRFLVQGETLLPRTPLWLMVTSSLHSDRCDSGTCAHTTIVTVMSWNSETEKQWCDDDGVPRELNSSSKCSAHANEIKMLTKTCSRLDFS